MHPFFPLSLSVYIYRSQWNLFLYLLVKWVISFIPFFFLWNRTTTVWFEQFSLLQCCTSFTSFYTLLSCALYFFCLFVSHSVPFKYNNLSVTHTHRHTVIQIPVKDWSSHPEENNSMLLMLYFLLIPRLSLWSSLIRTSCHLVWSFEQEQSIRLALSHIKFPLKWCLRWVPLFFNCFWTKCESFCLLSLSHLRRQNAPQRVNRLSGSLCYVHCPTMSKLPLSSLPVGVCAYVFVNKVIICVCMRCYWCRLHENLNAVNLRSAVCWNFWSQ